MAEVVPEKTGGLKFAERQLLRHGWEHGKGLGRAENGISEAIKVKVKCDKGGVGHREGEQFSFHWWDHVFNKASASLQVETHQNGIKLKKTAEEEEDGTISNKKPRKALLAKSKLYGCFVKSATLLSGQEQPEPKASASDDSSSSEEEEEQKLDLSSTTKLSDADLMKACGGRTAHKGARHGLTMSAKLARLEQQEAEFMATYGKKSPQTRPPSVCVAPNPPTVRSEPTVERRREKKKKKKSTERSAELNDAEVCESPETEVQPKKKKKKKKDKSKEELPAEGDRNCERRENITEQNGAEGAAEETQELNYDFKPKKRKKSSKNDKTAEEVERREEESIQSEDRIQEEEEVAVTTEKRKRKKSKKEKLLTEKRDEEFPPKKKKKKSKD